MKSLELSPWAGTQPNFFSAMSAYSHFLIILLWFQKAPATHKKNQPLKFLSCDLHSYSHCCFEFHIYSWSESWADLFFYDKRAATEL